MCSLKYWVLRVKRQVKAGSSEIRKLIRRDQKTAQEITSLNNISSVESLFTSLSLLLILNHPKLKTSVFLLK